MQGKYVTAIAIALVLLGHEGRAQSSDEEAAAQSSIQSNAQLTFKCTR